jgi:hypothetical protein
MYGNRTEGQCSSKKLSHLLRELVLPLSGFQIMTSGHPSPFGHIGYHEFVQSVVNEDVRPDRPCDDECPDMSDGFWKLAEQCWVKDPLRRPSASPVCALLHEPQWSPTVPSVGSTSIALQTTSGNTRILLPNHRRSTEWTGRNMPTSSSSPLRMCATNNTPLAAITWGSDFDHEVNKCPPTIPEA